MMAEKPLIERALPYYLVAITVALAEFKNEGHPTWQDIDDYWEGITLKDQELITAAFEICVINQIVEPLRDEFAPTLLVRLPGSAQRYQVLKRDLRFAETFNKYAKGGKRWLMRAILSVNKQREDEQKTNNSTAGNRIDPRWEPIPLDRADEKLQDATSKLEEAIETVRSDNGYNATHPEEARYVIDGLRMLAKRLKEDVQISWIFIDDGLQRLSLVVNRFGKAATGIAAKAAKSALTEWIKGLGLDFLKSLIK